MRGWVVPTARALAWWLDLRTSVGPGWHSWPRVRKSPQHGGRARLVDDGGGLENR
jgi:hypothetical protein